MSFERSSITRRNLILGATGAAAAFVLPFPATSAIADTGTTADALDGATGTTGADTWINDLDDPEFFDPAAVDPTDELMTDPEPAPPPGTVDPADPADTADDPDPDEPAVPPAGCEPLSFPWRSEIGGVPLYYEDSGLARSFEIQTAFYRRLESWWSFWKRNVPTSWQPARIYSYGTYDQYPCESYHRLGRAIDLTRVYVNGTARAFNGRYDLWRTHNVAKRSLACKRYWATAASLHYYFDSVLTYPYNADHHNHVHVDNGYSGVKTSTLDVTRSPQVLHIAHSLKYIWGYDQITSSYRWVNLDPLATEVLRRIGRRSGTLTSARSNWLAFNRATTRFGSGRQLY